MNWTVVNVETLERPKEGQYAKGRPRVSKYATRHDMGLAGRPQLRGKAQHLHSLQGPLSRRWPAKNSARMFKEEEAHLR